MITTKKRGKFEIYGDMLEAIGSESEFEGGARLTRVQSRSNLAYDRFRKDLSTLQDRGLVQVNEGEETTLRLTEAGREYLRHYRDVRKFLETYGL